MLHNQMKIQQMHICKCVQLHITNFHQHVLVTLVTIISVSYSNSTLIIQLIVLKCMITPLHVTLNFQ